MFSSQPQTIDMILFAVRATHFTSSNHDEAFVPFRSFHSALYTSLAFPLPEILVGEIMFLTPSLRRQTMKKKYSKEIRQRYRLRSQNLSL